MLSHQGLIYHCPPLTCVGKNSPQPGHRGLPKFWWEDEHRSPSRRISKWRRDSTCRFIPRRRGSAWYSLLFRFTWILSPSPQFESFSWRDRTKLVWPHQIHFQIFAFSYFNLSLLNLGDKNFLYCFSFFNLVLKFLLAYWGPCISKFEWEIIIGVGAKNN